MSDRILKALMQLFAIVANTDEVGQNGRALVERFLRWQLPRHLVEYYLKSYDEFLFRLNERIEEGKVRKRTSVNSVKVLRICAEINKELEQKQKIIVLIRLYEFIWNAAGNFSDQHIDFLHTVAETFSISEFDRENCRAIASGRVPEEQSGFLHTGPNTGGEKRSVLPQGMSVLTFSDPLLIVFRYDGNDSLSMDGREVQPHMVRVFEPGSVIRGPRISPVYYNDIISSLRGGDGTPPIVFEVNRLSYSFGGTKMALHPLSFTAMSGQLVGIMGNSGAGKTTLLNLLNGSLAAGGGEIRVNGQVLKKGNNDVRSLVGNVPQDDLLIEELSVFQNLYFSSRLYFGELSEEEIQQKVDKILQQLQLYEVRHLKVGDPLNKFISGGQRKRLNIALELIREPEILFVDEPTSGLSSSDSENVMDLLKELALSGKLVFVVIHQPSSEIFKLFDQLLVLDTGGYAAYYGNPVDSLSYFRRQMNYANFENSECPECGNINPEEIFSIINARTVDEFGKPTFTRKIFAEDWYRLFIQNFSSGDRPAETNGNGLTKTNRVAGRFRQFAVYFKRNLLAKLQNTQYMGITLLEGPLLAFILAFTLRSSGRHESYYFGDNPNIPAYIFISTIVALFLGLITSAEEIIQDRKILRRESYLKLSRQSFLLSKVTYLFLVSALQSALFTAVGHIILGFPGMYFSYFLMLFAVSCMGNLIGLNISSALKTRVAVYILIPFLVIPQIMLSGVMVRFEELNPWVTHPSRVPLVGNIMATRWAFEGLAVKQFSENDYEKHYFGVDKELNNIIYRKDNWLPLLEEQLPLAANDAEKGSMIMREYGEALTEFPVFESGIKTSNAAFHPTQTSAGLDSLRRYMVKQYNLLLSEKDRITESLIKRTGSEDKLRELRLENSNESLRDLVLNTNSLKAKVLLAGDRIVRRFRPVYTDARSCYMAEAPFYSAEKSVFGICMSTYTINILVIGLMSLVLYVLLYYDVLRRALEKELFRFSRA